MQCSGVLAKAYEKIRGRGAPLNGIEWIRRPPRTEREQTLLDEDEDAVGEILPDGAGVIAGVGGPGVPDRRSIGAGLGAAIQGPRTPGQKRSEAGAGGF